MPRLADLSTERPEDQICTASGPAVAAHKRQRSGPGK
jgi:hypothetical protein